MFHCAWCSKTLKKLLTPVQELNTGVIFEKCMSQSLQRLEYWLVPAQKTTEYIMRKIHTGNVHLAQVLRSH